MRTWILMLGGMMAWALHFAGVYGIASVADVVQDAAAPPARWAIAGFTLVCLIAALGFGLANLRVPGKDRDPMRRLTSTVGAAGGGVAAIAILWQALPALIGH